MILLHALAIRVNDLKEQLRSMTDEEVKDLYEQFIAEENLRDGDDYRNPQVAVAQEWKKRTCEFIPVNLP